LSHSAAGLAAPALVPYPGKGAHPQGRRSSPQGRPLRGLTPRMRILLIAENDLFARWAAVCLAAAGHQVHAMTPGSLRLTRWSRHCRGLRPCGRAVLKRSDASLLERIDRYCLEHRVECLVPADLPASLLLARGRQTLRVRGIFPISDAAVIER